MQFIAGDKENSTKVEDSFKTDISQVSNGIER